MRSSVSRRTVKRKANNKINSRCPCLIMIRAMGMEGHTSNKRFSIYSFCLVIGGHVALFVVLMEGSRLAVISRGNSTNPTPTH